jgi:hypothetical protein
MFESTSGPGILSGLLRYVATIDGIVGAIRQLPSCGTIRVGDLHCGFRDDFFGCAVNCCRKKR